MSNLSPTMIWPEIGNDQVIEFLSRSLVSHKIAQTYVFAGPNKLGKATIALAFSRNLLRLDENTSLQVNLESDNFLSINSDLHILEPGEDKKNISIEQVREFIKILNLSSFLNSYKIGIIKEADRLSAEGKNALLKTLEEPKKKVIIILLVTAEENLPKTILSRSQILYFHPVPATIIYDYLLDNYKVSRSLARDLSNLALGRPLRAVAYLENPDLYKVYLSEAKLLLSLFSLDINERLQVLAEVFPDRGFSQLAVNRATEILAMMEGLLRDLLLLSLSQKDRLQHSVLRSELEKVATIWEEANSEELGLKILKKLKLIIQAKDYLAANVNPHLVLEELIINLI